MTVAHPFPAKVVNALTSKPVTEALSLSVTVDLEAWMTAYGQTEDEARTDVRGYLTEHVQHAVVDGLTRLEWFVTAETVAAPVQIGDRVRTTDHGFVGTVKKLHPRCPMGAAQFGAQQVPLTKDLWEAPWVTVHPDTGGSMYAPVARVERV